MQLETLLCEKQSCLKAEFPFYLSLNSRNTFARLLPPDIIETSMARRKLKCTLIRS